MDAVDLPDDLQLLVRHRPGQGPADQRTDRRVRRRHAPAGRLVRDLDRIDWPDKVRTMQRNWIGRSTGAHVHFATDAGAIEVFTTRPDTLFGATYMVLAPEHPMVDALTADAWPDGTQQAW